MSSISYIDFPHPKPRAQVSDSRERQYLVVDKNTDLELDCLGLNPGSVTRNAILGMFSPH